MRFSRLTKWASEQLISLNPSYFINFAQKFCSFSWTVEDLCHAVATFVALSQEAHRLLLRSIIVHKGLSKVALCYLLWFSVPNWASVFVVLVAAIRKIVQLGVICRPGDADTTIMCLSYTRILYILRVLVVGLSCTAARTSLSARLFLFFTLCIHSWEGASLPHNCVYIQMLRDVMWWCVPLLAFGIAALSLSRQQLHVGIFCICCPYTTPLN
jgi:hypothetical protein